MNKHHEIEAATEHHNLFFGNLPVRMVVDEDGVPWWVARDVCEALGIEWKGSHSLGPLDDDERGSIKLDTPGGQQVVLAISEPGLYALVHSSRKPQAKAFKRWVNHEVLPAIHRTGGYGHPAAESNFIANLAETVTRMFQALNDRLDRLETERPKTGELPAAKAQANLDTAHITAFVAEDCLLDLEIAEAKQVLYNQYRNWCRAHGELPYDYNNFFKGLYRAGLPVRKGVHRSRREGKETRVVRGLRIRHAGEARS